MLSTLSRGLLSAVVALGSIALPAGAAVNVGDKPVLAFTPANGGPAVSLAKYKGKIIVVDFWATWCGPCMAEAGHMVQVNSTYAPQGMQFIGISLDNDLQAMRDTAKQSGFTWPQMCDGGAWQSKPAVAWGVNSIPRTFIIGPEGDVLWTGHPANLDAALARAFKDHPPQLVDPKVMAVAVVAADKIDAAIKGGAPASAISLLASVPAAAKDDPKFATRLTELENQLDAAAAKSLDEIDPLIQKKQYSDAANRLNEIIAALGSKPSGVEAKKRLGELMSIPQARAQIELTQKSKAAQEELAAAQQLQAAGKDEEAYVHFKGIVTKFSGTPAAQKASQSVAAYEKNPALVQKANDAAAAPKVKSMIAMARNYLSAGRPDLARSKYRDIITLYPNTTAAKQAQEAIDQIDTAPKK